MEDSKALAPEPKKGLMGQVSDFWLAYNGYFAWCAAITISCALGGVMGGIRSTIIPPVRGPGRLLKRRRHTASRTAPRRAWSNIGRVAGASLRGCRCTSRQQRVG